MEKERVRSALRSLVADPATDFTVLDSDEFFAALRWACQNSVTNAGLIADFGRRLADGRVASRDLHQVLFVAGDGGAWDSVRGAAMAVVARQPKFAVEILTLEIQRGSVAPMRVIESAADGGFTAQASLDREGVTIQGQPSVESSKKRARQRAVVSLLAVLVGIPVPEENRAEQAPEVPAPEVPVPAVDPAEVEAWLDYVVGRPEPEPELAGQLVPGRLTTRSLYLLLFETRGHGWRIHRGRAWDFLVATPSRAQGVLSMCTQARSWPPAGYLERIGGTALAYLTTPDGPVVGEPAVAAGSRAARAAAALALVKDLAQPADAAPGPAVPGGNTVGLLNERAQAGVIADLTYALEVTGPAHRPVFTCTASCVHASDRYVATAEDTSKNAAKAAASADLLEQLLSAERAHLARLAQTHRDQARSPEGIFTRLLRAGYPVDFTGRTFRIGGDLPEPLAGYELPVLSALPVLATLDSQVDLSVRGWASATKSALGAVAARRVYPALDSDGRDCWRLALDIPSDPAQARFLDTVAELLLRPPGARLVIGDLPYAGRTRLLDQAAADWADGVADAVEGTAAAPLVIRLSPPDQAGLPLHAELQADRFGRAEERLVRRACRQWPALERVRRDGTVGGAEAAQLLGPVGNRLAELGITAEWPADLVAASGMGRQIVIASSGSSGSGGFSSTAEANLTWRLSMDGEPLTEEETRAAAEAVEGVARIRGRWVVIDAETRLIIRDRGAGRLTGSQALEAALTGRVTVAGRSVACVAAGQLRDLLATLQAAGPDAADRISGPEGLQATLRGYQRVAVQWLLRTTSAGFGALLADDMGLGKTLTVIAFRLSRKDAGPSLVVCPASLLANWERECARFAPGIPVRRHHAADRSLDGLRPGDVVITTYGTLLRDAATIADVPWDLVVADEAQQIKNHRSQAARTLRSLRSAARVAVTGTPVENSLTELWAILDWTNPGLFGSLAAFRERYGRAAERESIEAGVDSDAARRLGRLIAPFVMRRRKTDPDVAPELPDKVIKDRYVELTREQVALYQTATADALERIATSDGLQRRGQVLRLLQALRQICNSPAHYLRESPDDWDAVRQAARSGKLEVLEELMESVIRAGDAALIFTSYVSMGHLIRAHLAARGMRTEFLHGGVTVTNRQEIVDRFQSGAGDALVLSVRAAGTGLNLTRAGHVIHFDRPWNPAVEDQATDRAHRIGQHRLVEVHHLIAEGTVEDRIAGLLARKRQLTAAVLPGDPAALTELSDGELSELVRLGASTFTGGAQ